MATGPESHRLKLLGKVAGTMAKNKKMEIKNKVSKALDKNYNTHTKVSENCAETYRQHGRAMLTWSSMKSKTFENAMNGFNLGDL